MASSAEIKHCSFKKVRLVFSRSDLELILVAKQTLFHASSPLSCQSFPYKSSPMLVLTQISAGGAESSSANAPLTQGTPFTPVPKTSRFPPFSSVTFLFMSWLLGFTLVLVLQCTPSVCCKISPFC
ncbi:unnamed protein product [Sphacelaria rigidula]